MVLIFIRTLFFAYFAKNSRMKTLHIPETGTPQRGLPPFCLVLIVVLALINAVIYYYTPLYGDDLAYKGLFMGPEPTWGWAKYYRWFGFHWVYVNGRMANLLVPFFLAIPWRWLTALIFSFMYGLMLYMPCRIIAATVKINVSAACTICMTLMCFGLPWWDSMLLLDCQTNYVWSSALVICAFWLIFHAQPTTKTGLAGAMLLCAWAGATHEGASLPLAIAMTLWLWYNRQQPDKRGRLLAGAFAAGTVWVTFSPGILRRAAIETIPDDPMWLLALKSDWAVILMIIIIAIALCSNRGRQSLRTVASKPFGMFAVAALISGAISVKSGIVGRSGWFAQIYAFIFMLCWLMPYLRMGRNTNIGISLISGLLMLAQLSYTAFWYIKLYPEHEQFEKLYTESDNGLVFMDYTKDDEIPVIALGRPRGIPDADDVYMLWTVAGYYGENAPWPVPVPAAFADNHTPAAGDSVRIGKDVITPELPSGAYRYYNEDRYNVWFVERGGTTNVVTPFIADGKEYYFITPRVVDPGDR